MNGRPAKTQPAGPTQPSIPSWSVNVYLATANPASTMAHCVHDIGHSPGGVTGLGGGGGGWVGVVITYAG